MRKISSVMLIMAGLLGQSTATALAFGDQTIFFWEDARSFGWSDIPDRTNRNLTPPPLTSNMSITERCGRLVGRQMVRDRSGRVYSTQLEDACIRNGGKI